MVETQTRGLLALAVALLVVMGLLFAQGPEELEADPEATVPMWSVDGGQVERLTLVRPADTVTLVRDGPGWRIETPFEGPADPERVGAVIDALARVERGVPVPEPEDGAAYGLGATPEAVVSVVSSSGMEQQLRIGQEAPVGYRTYAQRGEGPVVAVAGGLHPLVTESADRFRDHRVFGFDPGEVRRVWIRSPQGTLDLSGERTTWFLAGYGRADADKVDDVVVGLLDLRFDTFLDSGQRVEGGRYEVGVVEASGAEHVLRIGDETPMGVVASTEAGAFGTIYADALKQLDRGPRSVLDPRAFVLDLDRADEVTVELEGRHFHAVRNGPAWESEQVPSDVAYRAVQALAEVAATHRAELPEGASEGHGKVMVRADGALRVIWLGEEQGAFRLAHDGAGGDPYRVVVDDLAVFSDLVW